MVKTVVGDETQLKLVETRLTGSSLPCQVGLVIGKLSLKLDRGFVYDLVPTPPNDTGDPPCSIVENAGESGGGKKKSSSKAKSQSDASALFIDTDWVSEHARQTVKGVAEAASTIPDWNERLLVHISYSPLRWTCRNCSLSSNITSSSLRPCDFKLGKAVGSLQTFRCTYNFEIRLPIVQEGLNIKRFADALRNEITAHAKELTGAKALINGKLVIGDDQCVSGDFHQVEFLLPIMQDKYMEACSGKEVLGILLFSGSVCCLAYLNTKEPVSQALVDIKEDIIRSLQSRLDIMCDEADIVADSVVDADKENTSHVPTDIPVPHFDLKVQRKGCKISFPRRVFVPWLDGIYICDYIQSSEKMEVLKDHCIELMSLEIPADDSEIMEPESEAPTVVTSPAKTFWDITSDTSSAAMQAKSLADKTKRNPAIRADFISILALLVIIVSIILGLYVSC